MHYVFLYINTGTQTVNATESLQTPRLTKDAFFYSCQTAFEARNKKDGFDSYLRYEPFLLKTYKLPESANAKTFSKELTQIFQHHLLKTAQFKRKETITLDNHAWFTQAIATLLADVGTLLSNYTGQKIPYIPHEPVEFSDARPVLNAAIAKYKNVLLKNDDEKNQFQLFPIAEGLEEENKVAEAEQPLVFAAEVWDLLVQNIENTFSAEHAQMILEFFDWNFRPEQKNDKQIDWRIRPPVGELFFKYQKAMGFIKERPRFGDRKRDSQKDFKDKNNRDSRESKEAREPRENRPQRSDRNGEREDNKKRYTREDAAFQRRERPQKERVEFEDNKQALEHLRLKAIEQNCLELFDAALEEVREAHEKFDADKKLTSLPLAPQNPFIRRAQHSLAIELGYETESSGEGRERCVCLQRKK